MVVGSGVQAATLDPDRWRWSNPLPHGNNVLDMVVTPEVTVQVGDGGSVHVQFDGGRWSRGITGVTNYLRGVTLFNNRMLVVGEDGCILWSDNGRVFERAALSPGTTDWFEGVAASEARAVAVGDNGTIYTSTNGIAWTAAGSGTTQWLRGVARGNNIFVAVGENGTVLHSTTGISWSKGNSRVNSHLNRVRHLVTGSTGTFHAVGEGGVLLTSASGNSTWTAVSTGTTNALFDVVQNNTGTLLVGDQEIRYRPLGGSVWSDQIEGLPANAPPPWVYLSAGSLTNEFLAAGRAGLLIEGTISSGSTTYAWQPLPDSSHAWFWDIVMADGLHVAVGDLATVLTSLDGVLWTREVTPVTATNTVLLGVGGNTNLLLAAGNHGTVLASRAGFIEPAPGSTNPPVSTLGVLWTNLPPFTTRSLQGVDASENLYAISGDGGSLFTSPDGFEWTARSTPTTNFLSGLASFPGGWLAAGARGTLLRAGPDASAWTPIPLNSTNWLYRVRWVGDRGVVVGQNGALFTSADGVEWTRRDAGTTGHLNDVTYVGDTWFAAGNQGLLLASQDLVRWDRLPVPTVKSLFGAATAQGRLFLVGVEGVILRQAVVPRRSPVSILAFSHVPVVEEETFSWYDLFLFGGEPDQRFELESATDLGDPAWTRRAALEILDASGTLHYLRTQEPLDSPVHEFFRTRLIP